MYTILYRIVFVEYPFSFQHFFFFFDFQVEIFTLYFHHDFHPLLSYDLHIYGGDFVHSKVTTGGFFPAFRRNTSPLSVFVKDKLKLIRVQIVFSLLLQYYRNRLKMQVQSGVTRVE